MPFNKNKHIFFDLKKNFFFIHFINVQNAFFQNHKKSFISKKCIFFCKKTRLCNGRKMRFHIAFFSDPG